MSFNEIENKKPIYRVNDELKAHLKDYSRLNKLPITYDDLLHFDELIAVVDDDGNNTLWYSVIYNQFDMDKFHLALVEIYQMLVSEGGGIPYLRIDRIDYCSFGNSKPFRVRVINEINDNYDYFYIKRADASRIYGLELEEIFSPDKVNYLIHDDTLIEEHIVGIPADEFIVKHKGKEIENRGRLAKEFVRFNERCFLRLLGDMRAYNFVVVITQDFDNIQYRLRPMDFDQQSFEGRMNIYKPQYYKDNIALVNLARETMSIETTEQYQTMERVAMRKRYLAYPKRTKSLLLRMKKDNISSLENIKILRRDFAKYYKDESFLTFVNIGDILNKHLELALGVNILNEEE